MKPYVYKSLRRRGRPWTVLFWDEDDVRAFRMYTWAGAMAAAELLIKGGSVESAYQHGAHTDWMALLGYR